jgi:branched-chain amino acid transport system permease protein
MAFAVIFKATGIVNFAQGEMGMLTAYATWSLSVAWGTGAVLTVLMAIVIGALIGLVAERLVMRPMLGEPVLSVVLVTVGMAVILRSVVAMFWGASPHKFEMAGADTILDLAGIGLRGSQIAVVVTLLVALAGLWFFLRYSRFGVAMRAVASDEKTARLMGVSTAHVQQVAWAASSALAGLAGGFFAVIYGLTPTIFELGLKAFRPPCWAASTRCWARASAGCSSACWKRGRRLPAQHLEGDLRLPADPGGADGAALRPVRREADRKSLMRSGFYKERYGQLVGLSDSAAGLGLGRRAVAVLVAAPLSAGPVPAGHADGDPVHAGGCAGVDHPDRLHRADLAGPRGLPDDRRLRLCHRRVAPAPAAGAGAAAGHRWCRRCSG